MTTKVEGYGVKADSKALDTVILVGGLAALTGIGYVLWKIKKKADDIADIPSEIAAIPSKMAEATKASMTSTALKILPDLSGYNATQTQYYQANKAAMANLVVPDTSTQGIADLSAKTGIPAGAIADQVAADIQTATYTAGVAEQYSEHPYSTVIDTYLFGGSLYQEVQTDNQKLINALLPLSFSYNAGYVEAWINQLGWFDSIWYKKGIQSKTPEEIRTMAGQAFTTWLTRNYDSSGNARV